MRRKDQKRYHKTIGNKVASLYIEEHYLPKTTVFIGEKFKFEYIETGYYEFISACVSNSRRTNNDWYRGDRVCDKMYNVSTGTSTTFIAIVSMLEKHIDTFIKQYGYYCCMVDGTDEHRMLVYIKMMYHYAKKKKLNITTVSTDDGILCQFDNYSNPIDLYK